MTDRELLELAAKAAGISLEWDGPPDKWQPMYYQGKTYHSFDPLTDDGDALRLAVKLRIDVAHTDIHSPQVHALADAKVQVWEDSSGDPYVATRRAIVRAAAEIGRGIAQQTARADLPEDNYYKTMAEAEETGRTAAEIGRQMP